MASKKEKEKKGRKYFLIYSAKNTKSWRHLKDRAKLRENESIFFKSKGKHVTTKLHSEHKTACQFHIHANNS